MQSSSYHTKSLHHYVPSPFTMFYLILIYFQISFSGRAIICSTFSVAWQFLLYVEVVVVIGHWGNETK